MSLIVCGLNHKTAPLALREKVIFLAEDLNVPLADLAKLPGVNEAVIVSTCNRTEIYCDNSHQVPPNLVDWLAKWHHVSPASLIPHLYSYQDQLAVRHLFRVASGLDSMMLGETQIVWQLKQAVAIAEKVGTLGAHLHRLFRHAFNVSKKIRTQTEIGVNPITLGYVVVHLAKHIFADLPRCHILLIGAGETIQHIAQHLHAQGIHQLIVANRTAINAQSLVETFAAQKITLQDIPEYLPQVDIVVAATASQLPVLGKGTVESALKQRKHRPMLMIDLAVPRDIEPEVSQLEDIYLYAIDDLQTILEENRAKRIDAAKAAETIIDVQSQHFISSLRTLEVASLIRHYREHIMALRDKELAKALEELNLGNNPKEVLEKFSYSLTNKFLHQPSIKLRQAAYDGEAEVVKAIERLLTFE